ncbi:hypothetical protein HAX54_040262, partial [Datura stramonium]|nr:hypothetical protein [Datura stramonium]
LPPLAINPYSRCLQDMVLSKDKENMQEFSTECLLNESIYVNAKINMLNFESLHYINKKDAS